MNVPWIIAFALLAVCVALLTVVMLGTLRRISGVLEQTEARLREAPIASPGPGGLEPGSPLPAFSVRRFYGGWLTDDDIRGVPAIVVFISSTCPACSGLIRDLRRGADALPLPVYIVADNDDEVQALGLTNVANVLIQPKHELAIAFRTSTTPHAFAIDRSGTIVATSTPNALNQLRELIEPALERGGDAPGLEQVEVVSA